MMANQSTKQHTISRLLIVGCLLFFSLGIVVFPLAGCSASSGLDQFSAKQELDSLLKKNQSAQVPPFSSQQQPPLENNLPGNLMSEMEQLFNEEPQSQPEALPEALPKALSDDESQMATGPLDGFFAGTKLFKQPNVDIDETTSAYQVKIPMENPEDQKQVSVNVQSHRIEVSGQLTFGDQKSGFTGSSSFMRSFNTQSELEPGKVTRQLKNKVLVVTIPKKGSHGAHSASGQAKMQSKSSQTTASKNTPTTQSANKPAAKSAPKQLSPEVLRQLYQTQQKAI